jgi:DNA-binding response OmpR family regulator
MSNTNKRLLLIEDDYDVAEMLVMYFTSHGYDVLHADTGMAGIDLARTKFPNLILLDVMLPYMDGYDVCLRLRSTSLTKYIPILFLTQRDERASKVRGLELGADDYITKPFDIDELRLRVQGSIRRATRENLHEARTGLPTGPMVQEEILRKTPEQTAFTFTIEELASYHDVYGFLAANQVLAHAARTIQQMLSEKGTENDFVGIVNDDFIVLTQSKTPDEVVEAIRQKFNREVPAFYSFMDADRGGILVNDGVNGEKLVPIMHIEANKKVSIDTAS